MTDRFLPLIRHVQSQCWVRTKSPSRLKRKDFARVYQTHQAKNVNNFELLCHHRQTRESSRRAFSSISNYFFCYSKTTNQRAYRPTYREIARNVILYIKTLNHKLFKKIIFLRKTKKSDGFELFLPFCGPNRCSCRTTLPIATRVGCCRASVTAHQWRHSSEERACRCFSSWWCWRPRRTNSFKSWCHKSRFGPTAQRGSNGPYGPRYERIVFKSILYQLRSTNIRDLIDHYEM